MQVWSVPPPLPFVDYVFPDNFHVFWRHNIRRELYCLVRVGLDRNWQPVGYPNYDALKKRFNDLISTFSIPPEEFPLRNQDFAQLQMATHSVIVEAELTNREFYTWYWGAMDYQMSEKSLRALLKQESLLGRRSDQYTGEPLESNTIGNQIQNKLWIGKLLSLFSSHSFRSSRSSAGEYHSFPSCQWSHSRPRPPCSNP